MKAFVCSLIAAFVFPQIVDAAVTISEVAWMGDSTSANHEWIELYNDNESIDVTGWKISDGMNLNIELAGVIPASSYIVLERTSDDSASGNAFLIYTGALVNTGATLVLRRTDNSIEDQVAGGENWQNIGGDNTTKETAQYTTTGWITAAATPGKVNASSGSNPPNEEEKKSSSGSPSLMKPDKRETVSKLVESDSELTLKITAPKVGYVNQSIEFLSEASGLKKTIINSLSYTWNFGDLATSSKKSVNHIFSYPGKYLVVNEAKFDEDTAIATHEITILPVALSITRNPFGDIQINNDAGYDIDISGYVLAGKKKIKFPENSILLQSQTLTIAFSYVGGINQPVTLYDKTGVSVVRQNIGSESADISETSSEDEVGIVFREMSLEPSIDTSFGFVEKEVEQETILETATNTAFATKTSLTQEPLEKPPIWPYIALISLISAAVIGIILQPMFKKEG